MKTILAREFRCDKCNGQGCAACNGTGFVGRIEVREAMPLHPDELSEKLNCLSMSFGLLELARRLNVSLVRASQLRRGAGSPRTPEEERAALRLLYDTVMKPVFLIETCPPDGNNLEKQNQYWEQFFKKYDFQPMNWY